MCSGRITRGVCVAPPDRRSVVRINHHCVSCAAGLPAITSDAGVRVDIVPRMFLKPLILALIPAVLGEGRFVGGKPQVHSGRTVGEGDGGVVAVVGGKFGGIRIAVVVSVPAGL